jgi:hypothetical protein
MEGRPRKWIESRSILGYIDAFARIGIKAVGGMTRSAFVEPEEDATSNEAAPQARPGT